jgi:multidrug efflux pump subunit AcrA (membrane-fusion protein)
MITEADSKINIRVIDSLHESRLFFDLRFSQAVPIFIFLTIALFSGFCIWASFAKMDDVVKAQAVLRPIENISSIKSMTSGEVYEKNYAQNDIVTAGQVLIKFDVASDTLDLNNSNEYLAQLLIDERNYHILEQTIVSNSNPVLQDRSEAYTLCSTYMAEYSRLIEQKSQLLEKIDRELKLPSSMKTQSKINDLESELLLCEKNIVSWRNRELVSAQEKIKSIHQTIQSLERRISDLERNIKSAAIIAPISGSIDETLKINTGDFVMAGEELFRIIPDSASSIKAEIALDPSSIARVKKGQQIKLRFPSLPPSRFGQLEGYISLIPADVKIAGNNAVFIVEADIPHPYLTSQSGEKIFLRSGISAEGRIIIDNDTVLRMMLRKLDFIQ